MNQLPRRTHPEPLSPDSAALALIAAAAVDTNYVSLGSRRTASVHEFYRYPARFSPLFARAVIDALTTPGDLVMDPFVGGGTTLVEAQRSGRAAVGSDISSLAVFVATAKTLLYSAGQCSEVEKWADQVLNLRLADQPTSMPHPSGPEGRALNTAATWRLTRFIGTALDSIAELRRGPARALARCAVLRTAQWALDIKDDTPTVSAFRNNLASHALAMAEVATTHRSEVQATPMAGTSRMPMIRQVAASDLSAEDLPSDGPAPRLVLTSPPYPGVYVNYHRWKVRGRKETGAPFWIAACPDGHGLAHYTMGARADRSGARYFDALRAAWTNLAPLLRSDAWVVQLVGFSAPETQLDRYLAAMASAGLVEKRIPAIANSADGRLWRSVPGRRWWVVTDARTTAAPSTAREVVLFHRLAR